MSDLDEEDLFQDEQQYTGWEDEEQYQPPLSAVPPKLNLQDEGELEVSASPAFQCLDELFQEGKITGTRVAQLKAVYSNLYETLKSARTNEAMYLEEAKKLTTELERQNLELEHSDDFPENLNTEVSKLRMQLLKHRNDLAQAEERQYEFDYKIEGLQEEHRIIQREYGRMPKQGEVTKKIDELKSVCAELQKEISQRQNETKVLKEEYEKKDRQLIKDRSEFTTTLEELEKLKGDMVAVNTKPGQISKEADRFQRQKNEVDKKQKEVNSQLKELYNQMQRLQGRQQILEEEKFEYDAQVDDNTTVYQKREAEYQSLMKDFDLLKEREAVFMGDRATFDLNLRHINLEKKNAHDLHMRMIREKDRDIRNLKKAELQNKVAEDTLQHTTSVFEKTKSNLDLQPRDDGTLQQKRTDLQRDVEQTKRSLVQQDSLTAVETVKVEQSIAEEEKLFYEQGDLKIEVIELTRLAAIKNDEREQKARDFMRAEMRFHKAVQDVKSKQLEIQDKQKKYMEMQNKLKDFAKLYDVIKNERNKMVNLIQTSTQKASEMREKIKIFNNEMEILRTAVMTKDRQLQKQKLRHVNAIVVRDSLRNEVAKQDRVDFDMKEHREQQRMDITKLNMLITQAEEDMLKLRKRYENAVTHRNDRGIQLIERDEEVCIFYEKVNIQEQMIRNGDVELQAREEEIRFLKLQLQEEKRALELLRKNVPNKKALEQELVVLQIQLSQCQDRLMELEKEIEDPKNPADRMRILGGKDPAPVDLQRKLEELELRLSEKEEGLLEKDLVLEQVTRLAGRVEKKSASGKADTLSLAKSVNELQAKIKETTRSMMAQVAELSMHQANALRLQQEVKEKEAELQSCYIRMEKGEAPNVAIEQEWLRQIRDDARKAMDKENFKQAAEEAAQYELTGGGSTTAEPRPNAYIPQEDSELPIPRPYGGHAPFKPQESGSNKRHIRKPAPKPIEI